MRMGPAVRIVLYEDGTAGMLIDRRGGFAAERFIEEWNVAHLAQTGLPTSDWNPPTVHYAGDLRIPDEVDYDEWQVEATPIADPDATPEEVSRMAELLARRQASE